MVTYHLYTPRRRADRRICVVCGLPLDRRTAKKSLRDVLMLDRQGQNSFRFMDLPFTRRLDTA